MISNSKRFLSFAVALSAFAAFPFQDAAAEQDYSKVEIQTIPLARSVSMLIGAGGNIGVSAGKDGIFMIDDQFAPLTPKIKTAIKKISSEPIRFVLNTHWHFDHTGGNENLGKTGVTIVAHDNVRKTMSIDQALKAFNMTVPASPAVALPVITFNDSATFHLNGETISIQHVPPAHTDGDSIVHFEEANIIHTGDTFFNGIYPFIDVEHGGSIDGMIKAADITLKLANDQTQIIPGHGPLASKKDLVRFRDMLITARTAIKAAAQGGKSVEEVIAAEPLKELNAEWGDGFLKPASFITIVMNAI